MNVMSTSAETHDLVELTTEVVSAYVSNNPVPASELAGIIENVHSTLRGLTSATGQEVKEEKAPAVPLKKSVKADAIICLDCGKGFKSLKRHLATHHGMSPADYRTKWGLPGDYPIVAPNYASARSELAKQMGLGRKKKQSGRRPRKKSATAAETQ